MVGGLFVSTDRVAVVKWCLAVLFDVAIVAAVLAAQGGGSVSPITE
jgi:hypothetical protein